MRRRAILRVSTAMGLVIAVCVGVLFFTQQSQAEEGSRRFDPKVPDAVLLEEFDRGVAERAAVANAEDGIRPLLPPDVSDRWIKSWESMRSCVGERGWGSAVTPAAPSFGDGNTPPPYIVGTGDSLESALARCPFTVDARDQQVIADAGREATERVVREQDPSAESFPLPLPQ